MKKRVIEEEKVWVRYVHEFEEEEVEEEEKSDNLQFVIMWSDKYSHFFLSDSI